MSTIQELEQKVLRLEKDLQESRQQSALIISKADKAIDYATHAYKVDHNSIVWVRDVNAKKYVKTNMRIVSPTVADRALESRHIADGAIEGRHIKDDAILGSMIQDNTIQGRSLAPAIIGPEKIADLSIFGDHFVDGALVPGKLAPDAVSTRTIQDGAVTPEKLFPDLLNLILSAGSHGYALATEFGTSTLIGISQKTLTDAFNKLWEKIEDMTGESLLGISMQVTPDYFISEDGCTVSIKASTVETNGIFEHIAFYANGTLIAEADNVDYFEYDMEITETTIIKCVAKIMGVEYERQHIVTHYNSFWLGAGSTYSDIMDVKHVIPITNGMRGAYDVEVADGQSIIIIVGDSLKDGFLRADLNSVEIPFTETSVTVDDKGYRVYMSEPWSAGNYNIDING